MDQLKLNNMLQQFFLEDIGEGDVTTQTLFDSNDSGKGKFIVKEDGIISGMDIVRQGYMLLDPMINITPLVKDGDQVKKGQVIIEIEGPMQPLLTGERVVLNLLQRMSGIATLTRKAVVALNSQHTKISDTRKTTPGIRMLEKYAVTCGGGVNHRFGLYDAVMIKDNHIAKMGSISKAVEKVKETIGHMVKIEVETESYEQVLEAVMCRADVIMFDNCSPEQIRTYSQAVPEHIITEASGGITLETLPDYRSTGVDIISLGFLTHSAKSLDISFNLEGGHKS